MKTKSAILGASFAVLEILTFAAPADAREAFPSVAFTKLARGLAKRDCARTCSTMLLYGQVVEAERVDVQAVNLGPSGEQQYLLRRVEDAGNDGEPVSVVARVRGRWRQVGSWDVVMDITLLRARHHGWRDIQLSRHVSNGDAQSRPCADITTRWNGQRYVLPRRLARLCNN